MIDLGKWAFGHSKLVYFLLAVLLVGGLKSAYDMGKLEDPEVKVKIAMVVGVRPGASAHEMELEVTDPLEKAIRTVGEVDNTQSWSYNDLCIIQVELKVRRPMTGSNSVGICCGTRFPMRKHRCPAVRP